MFARPDCDFVAFDLETTGLAAESDRVVELGAVRFDRAGVEGGRFETLVNPGRPMSPSAQAVHGISDTHLADAPPIGEILPAFLDFLGPPDSTMLLAHNAWFDAGFLGRELARDGLEPPGHAVIDTLPLARQRLPRLSNHRLDTLATFFGLGLDSCHRALADSLRVKGLWLALGGPAEPVERLTGYPILDVRRKVSGPLGWDEIGEAIVRGWRVRMQYQGGTRGAGEREVTPKGFSQRGGVAYLVALCHLDHFEKSFRLDRVKQYEVLRSFGQTMTRRGDADCPTDPEPRGSRG